MKFNELSKEIETLDYRDKLRLAQLLIQLARKEEEEQHPTKRSMLKETGDEQPDLTAYVAERIKKSHPAKKSSLVKFINAMFQFQGGITDEDCEKIILELQRRQIIIIDAGNRVFYSEQSSKHG